MNLNKETQIVPDLQRQRIETAALNQCYESLAFDLDDGDKGNFFGGWQCNSPYTEPLFTRVRERTVHVDYGKYTYFDDELELSTKITAVHAAFDGTPPEYVFCGSGSTSLLYGMAAYLNRIGVREVYFLPPMYFTLRIAFDGFGIATIPVSERQSFETGFQMRLPEKKSVLILIDPIWYIGCPVPARVIDEIKIWQQKTGSMVMVDGSLQYMDWAHSRFETTARLDPSLTFRLICPSKQLASHGYRFSYVLVPLSQKQKFAWTYTNIYGSANADSVAFGHEAIAAIADRTIPDQLMQLVGERHRVLRKRKVIESLFQPSSGYFVFEKINLPLPKGYIKVGGKYFDQENYPDYSKINLLSPSISILGL